MSETTQAALGKTSFHSEKGRFNAERDFMRSHVPVTRISAVITPFILCIMLTISGLPIAYL